MNLPPLDVPGILRQFNLRPDKRLGQNFLIDPAGLQRVIDAARLQEEDTILEVGAGLGSLTRLMAARAYQVIAVELDGRLIPALQQVLEGYDNIKIVQGDILGLNPADLFHPSGDRAAHYLVVANIPYYITSTLIRHLLEAPIRPKRMTLTVQSEVAARICARPGDMSLLALSVQVYGQPQVAARLPAGAFYPAPKVDSSVVNVEMFSEPWFPETILDDFFRLAKAGFSQKRKTLRNALSAGMHWDPARTAEWLAGAGIDPQRRAETLSLPEWGALTQAVRSNPPAGR